MLKIDEAILNLCEWACRKLQLLTGRTNVWLAVQLTNLSIIVYFVWAGLQFVSASAAVRVGIGLFCGTLLYVLSQTVFRVSIETAEDYAYRRVARGLRNPRRLRDALLRVSFLTLALVLLYPVVFVWLQPPSPAAPEYSQLLAYLRSRWPIVLLGYLLILLTAVVLYLLACDPLPPCPGKVREWFRGIVPARLAPSRAADRR